jgi:hypothetical protein
MLPSLNLSIVTVNYPPLVILNLFQDNEPPLVILKQVQDDECLGSGAVA